MQPPTWLPPPVLAPAACHRRCSHDQLQLPCPRCCGGAAPAEGRLGGAVSSAHWWLCCCAGFILHTCCLVTENRMKGGRGRKSPRRVHSRRPHSSRSYRYTQLRGAHAHAACRTLTNTAAGTTHPPFPPVQLGRSCVGTKCAHTCHPSALTRLQPLLPGHSQPTNSCCCRPHQHQHQNCCSRR
jgi:hypothetical protein